MYDLLKDTKTTLNTLKQSNDNTDEISAILTTFSFEFDPQTNEPLLNDSTNKYYFDAENTFAIEQLCNWLKIKQFSFFIKRSADLKTEIVTECVDELSKKKISALLKVRKGNNKTYIRSILPHKYTTFKNSDVLETCQEEIDDKDIHFFRCSGYGLDEPSIKLIYVFNDYFEIDQEKFYLGFDIVASELGDHKLEMNGLVYNETHDIFYKISFNRKPYYLWKYRGDEPDFAGVLTDIISVIRSRKTELKEKVAEARKEFYQTNEELYRYFDYLELNVASGKALKDLKLIVLADPSYYKTKYSLANFVAHLATEVSPSEKDNGFWRGKTFDKINKIENFAGYLLDLELNI